MVLHYPMPVFMGILSVLFIMIGFKIVDFSIDAHLLSDKLDKKSNRLIRDILKVTVFMACAIIYMRYGLGLDLLSIVTHSAILTAIIGLALQDTLSNVISGIIIQMEKPFTIGDWVEIDGLRGKVAETNWRYTKIRSWEDYFVHIPNNKVSSNVLTNLSRPTKSVVRRLEVGISLNDIILKYHSR
ncbi:MAG: mechanosensitive ion channel domain-containing protein [Candidatus Muiribacteriota bacterium]